MRLPNLPLLRSTLLKRLLLMTLLLSPKPNTCEFFFGSLSCFGLFVNLILEQFLFNLS